MLDMTERRFDIVVLNYRRLRSFLGNFHRIRAFAPSRDRITVLSCSPSTAEADLVRDFERRHGLSVRYLTRENRGIDQLARAEYFTGAAGSLEENLAYAYIFHMQDHYLDPEDSGSRWGPELGFGTKGDVVPDGVVFDLDAMEQLAQEHNLAGFFCDRNDPSFISIEGRRYVAPSGGNFAIRTDLVAEPDAQTACRSVIDACDDTYAWAVYAEFNWGPIFFREGRRFYDLKRERLFERWAPDDFYHPPDDIPKLKRRFEGPPVRRAVMRTVGRARLVLGRVAGR
jgi:hypothetical protein